jgi:4-amino-4-deoxy-L-arabinose transferase
MAKFPLLFLAALAFAMIFQGSRGIWEPDEGRYTDISVQMLRTGEFLQPAYNDEFGHFAKPPLAYWAIAGGIRLLGWNEWGVRLANALAFAGTVLVVFALAGTITPARPWLPPLVYASSLLPFAAANVVTTDTLLAFWEALAVLGFVEWWKSIEVRPRISGVLLMWFGFAMAFLTKGPPGLLPLLAIVSFAAIVNGKRAVAGLFPVAGIAIFAVFGLGWYVAVASTHPGLAAYFLSDEVVKRIATGAHHRNAQWYGAFAVYVPTLILGTLPWTHALFRGAWTLPRKVLSRPWWREKAARDPWGAFLALWLLLPLAVFFVSRSRLSLYILPLFPALALMTARRLPERAPRRTDFVLVALWMTVLVALKGGASLYPYKRDSRPLAREIAAHALPAPYEVVFIETTPFWGVSLYLKCEVEHVRLAPSSSPMDYDDGEDLLKECAGEWPRMFLVTGRRNCPDVESLLGSSGYPVRRVGETDEYAFLAPVSCLRERKDAAAAPGF